jgi:energy-coupling factor transporter ATP-binding protein EcfA2
MASVTLLLQPKPEFVDHTRILIVGQRGAGKTTLANHILQQLGASEAQTARFVGEVTEAAVAALPPSTTTVFVEDCCIWDRSIISSRDVFGGKTVIINTQYALDVPKTILNTLSMVVLFPNAGIVPYVDKDLVAHAARSLAPYDAFVVDFTSVPRRYSVLNALGAPTPPTPTPGPHAATPSDPAAKSWFGSIFSWFWSSPQPTQHPA